MPASAALLAAAISIVCCALLSPSARASTAITRVPDDSVALAGPDVLVARVKDREMRLVAYPVEGGAGVVRFRFTTPPGSIPHAEPVASAGTVGLIAWTDGQNQRGTFQTFGGPPTGPLAPLGPPIRYPGAVLFPSALHASGERLLLAEGDEFGNDHYSVREPGGPWIALGLPVSEGPIGFAGDLVAYAVRLDSGPRDGISEKLVVREWRTGLERWSAVIPDLVESLDLRADGSVVVAAGNEIVYLGPGGSPRRRITADGARPAFAGDAVVFVRGDENQGPQRLILAEPGGRLRRFGATTGRIGALFADEERVVWTQNNCVLAAEIADLPGTVPPAGPCPRTEITLAGGLGSLVGRDRLVPVVLQCVAAAPAGCRGVVSLRSFDGSDVRARRVAFRIRPGAKRRILVRLTERAYADAVREAAADQGVATLNITAMATDPAGRRSGFDDPFAIRLP